MGLDGCLHYEAETENARHLFTSSVRPTAARLFKSNHIGGPDGRTDTFVAALLYLSSR